MLKTSYKKNLFRGGQLLHLNTVSDCRWMKISEYHLSWTPTLLNKEFHTVPRKRNCNWWEWRDWKPLLSIAFFPHAIILSSHEDVNIHFLLFMHGKSNNKLRKSHKQTHFWIFYNLVVLFFTVYDLTLNEYANSFTYIWLRITLYQII